MIPYAGGPSQALSDLIAGRVQIVLDGYPGVGPGIEGGSIKGIAVATTKRVARIPEPADGRGNAARASSPAAGTCSVRAAWNAGRDHPQGERGSCASRSKTRTCRRSSRRSDTYVQPMTPEELTAFIQEQQKVWKPVAEAVAAAQKK